MFSLTSLGVSSRRYFDTSMISRIARVQNSNSLQGVNTLSQCPSSFNIHMYVYSRCQSIYIPTSMQVMVLVADQQHELHIQLKSMSQYPIVPSKGSQVIPSGKLDTTKRLEPCIINTHFFVQISCLSQLTLIDSSGVNFEEISNLFYAAAFVLQHADECTKTTYHGRTNFDLTIKKYFPCQKKVRNLKPFPK